MRDLTCQRKVASEGQPAGAAYVIWMLSATSAIRARHALARVEEPGDGGAYLGFFASGSLVPAGALQLQELRLGELGKLRGRTGRDHVIVDVDDDQELGLDRRRGFVHEPSERRGDVVAHHGLQLHHAVRGAKDGDAALSDGFEELLAGRVLVVLIGGGESQIGELLHRRKDRRLFRVPRPPRWILLNPAQRAL